MNRIFVTDFDGTISRNDFYELVAAKLLPAGTPDYWDQYRAGRITHFEALRNYFAAIRADEAAVWQVALEMDIDPQLAAGISRLRAAGWRVVVASAGCRWYIERHLREAGVDVELHGNPGYFQVGRGLMMDLPHGSPFLSPTHGIDKAAIVRHYQNAGCQVAFAGDGYPDEQAARRVPAELRFARGALAEALKRGGESFHPFSIWWEIVPILVEADPPKDRGERR